MDGAYKGVGGWGGVMGMGSKPQAGYPVIRAQIVVLCSQQMTGMSTNHRIDQDGYWQQFGTQPILISAPQWHWRRKVTKSGGANLLTK